MSDQLYANGRIAVMSNKLLSADKFTRLAECSCLAEALKVLSENGYGAGVAVENPNDYDRLISAELENAISIMNELCFDRKAADYFLARYAYHNAKVLLKSKYMRTDGVNGCFKGVGADPETLQQAFVNDDYSLCSQKMAEACDKIDAEFADGNRSAQVVDTILDRALYDEMFLLAKRCKTPFVRKLYDAEVNTINLMLIYRMKKAALGRDVFQKTLLENGSIKKETLLSLWDSDGAAADLPSEYRSFYSLCVYPDNKNLTAAEAAQKEMRDKIVVENNDPLTIQPVVKYFFNKVDETDKVRFALISVKNGVDKETIKNSLV